MTKDTPDNICGVVTEGLVHSGSTLPVRHKCQFSWYCDGKKDDPKNEKAWGKALLVAVTVYDGKTVDMLDGATHYHATYVNPKWNKDMLLIGRIGLHIFYVAKIIF